MLFKTGVEKPPSAHFKAFLQKNPEEHHEMVADMEQMIKKMEEDLEKVKGDGAESMKLAEDLVL